MKRTTDHQTMSPCVSRASSCSSSTEFRCCRFFFNVINDDDSIMGNSYAHMDDVEQHWVHLWIQLVNRVKLHRSQSPENWNFIQFGFDVQNRFYFELFIFI